MKFNVNKVSIAPMPVTEEKEEELLGELIYAVAPEQIIVDHPMSPSDGMKKQQ